VLSTDPNILFQHQLSNDVLIAVNDAISAIERGAETTPLCELMTAFQSDKGSGKHNYTQLYWRLLAPYRRSAASVLEVGIGTNFTDVPSSMGLNGVPGASLRAWRAFFTKANIYGADVDRRILFSEDRITTHYIDQLNSATIDDFFASVKEEDFDIIIDDGLHRFDANHNLFSTSQSRLSSSGLYLIEDIVGSVENVSLYCEMIVNSGMCGAVVRLPNALNVDDDNCVAILCPDA